MNHPSKPLRIMRLPLLLLAGLPWTLAAQNIAINATGAAPAAQAMLDVSSTTKGMLAPRMSAAQRAAIATPAQGLTVYQTDAPKGFWYYQAGWVYVGSGGGISWDLTGNTMPTSADPNINFLGSTNAQPLIFRTNNVERMRILGTNGYLGVGTTTPTERLDVNGGLRIYNDLTTTGNGTGTYSVAGSASSTFVHSLTSQAGTIMYQHYPYRVDSVSSAIWRGDTVMWAGHWGNVSNTAASALPGSATAPPNPGGWQRLGNDYNEVVRATADPWTHPPGTICATPGDLYIPVQGAAEPGVFSTAAPLQVPFGASTANTSFRSQYLFKANELNLESNFAENGINNPNGLCPGAPISAVSFYFNATAAKTIAVFSVTVKNVPTSFNSLNTFLPTIDPAGGCYYPGGSYVIPATTTGWYDIPLTNNNFTWDGVSNVVVEVAGRTTAAAVTTMAAYTPAWSGNKSYSVYRANCTGLSGNAALCGGSLNLPATMTISSCTGATGAVGASTTRPIIRFRGQVATQDPAIITAGAGGRYLQYPGGFMVETVTGTLPWGRKMTTPFNFKGPGTLVAQRGVYDSGTRLNDHVFDRAFDGRVHPDDAADLGDQRNLTMEEMAAHTRTDRHLPTMKGRAEWEAEGGFSLGDLTNQLWTTTETHALYLTDLHDRLNTLEALTNDRPLNGTEAVRARTDLLRMRTLTDGEKALLVRSLTERTTSVNTTR